MELENSNTKKNLEIAFSCESQARSKYTYFASIAKKEGYEQIGEVFSKIADNEKEHARMWLKYLGGIKTTVENLQSAAEGEKYESETMYDKFSKIAAEEGFFEISEKFLRVGDIEGKHEERFSKLVQNIKTNEVFEKKLEVCIWECRNCGYIHYGLKAPLMCPVCSHPQSYFEMYSENY